VPLTPTLSPLPNPRLHASARGGGKSGGKRGEGAHREPLIRHQCPPRIFGNYATRLARGRKGASGNIVPVRKPSTVSGLPVLPGFQRIRVTPPIGTRFAFQLLARDGERLLRNTPDAAEIRNRRATFKAADIYHPTPGEFLCRLYGGEVLQGRILDLTACGEGNRECAVIEVDRGICAIVPVDRIILVL
jgi:hypothetical protein